MNTVGQKVVLRRGSDGGRQAGAELLLQKTDDLAHALQGEAAATQLANHSDCDQFVPSVNAAMSLAGGAMSSFDVNSRCIGSRFKQIKMKMFETF